MTEADLERIIAAWYQQLGTDDGLLRLGQTADCPPLTRLWRHVAQGEPLGEYEDHVGKCDRCRRLCEIIEREHDRIAETAPLGRRRLFRPPYAIGGLLAAAACIALLVVSWPQPSFEAEVAAFADRADGFTSPVRGDGEEAPTAEPPQQSAWITAALDDPGVQDALAAQVETEGAILHELGQGGLRIDPDGRVTLAADVDEATARGRRLVTLIQQDRAACETIVDALVRHVPGATAKDRPRLSQALNRWRAENVFGRD